MKYARINNDAVSEILEATNGFPAEQCFHPDLLAMCERVAYDVQVGWVRQEDGSFAAPVVETPEEPAP